MLVCTSCNIEYDEDRKFCKHCSAPLVPKLEPISAQTKANRTEEEQSDGKLICPHCKILYEFGSSCIQCGSPLGRQISPQAKEEPVTSDRRESEDKPSFVETSPEQQMGVPPSKLFCPTCKIIYESGNVCIKCESALVAQLPTETDGTSETSRGAGVEQNPLKVQTIQEQLIQTPREKLICPACKIIYERGTSCVRCGAALVPQTQSKEEEKPKPSDTEFNRLTPEPDGLEDPFLPRASTEISTASGRRPEAAPEQPSLSGPQGQDSGVTEQGKKREFRATPTPELSLEQEFLQVPTPDQPVAKKSPDDLHKRFSFLSRFKKDYRRLSFEVGSIVIMVLAGGYLLWSVYSYLTKPKPAEPGTSVSEEVAVQTLPRSVSSRPPAPTVAGSGASRNTESSSSISKQAIPAPPPQPDASGTPSAEIREIGNIKIVLENIRRANLHEDIDLFIHCYASDFRNKEEKRQATLANWRMFNYHELSYDLKKTTISDNTAKARVEWVIKTSSKAGGRLQENRSILDVTFKKEEGRWKIEEVKPTR